MLFGSLSGLLAAWLPYTLVEPSKPLGGTPTTTTTTVLGACYELHDPGDGFRLYRALQTQDRPSVGGGAERCVLLWDAWLHFSDVQGTTDCFDVVSLQQPSLIACAEGLEILSAEDCGLRFQISASEWRVCSGCETAGPQQAALRDVLLRPTPRVARRLQGELRSAWTIPGGGLVEAMVGESRCAALQLATAICVGCCETCDDGGQLLRCAGGGAAFWNRGISVISQSAQHTNLSELTALQREVRRAVAPLNVSLWCNLTRGRRLDMRLVEGDPTEVRILIAAPTPFLFWDVAQNAAVPPPAARPCTLDRNAQATVRRPRLRSLLQVLEAQGDPPPACNATLVFLDASDGQSYENASALPPSALLTSSPTWVAEEGWEAMVVGPGAWALVHSESEQTTGVLLLLPDDASFVWHGTDETIPCAASQTPDQGIRGLWPNRPGPEKFVGWGDPVVHGAPFCAVPDPSARVLVAMTLLNETSPVFVREPCATSAPCDCPWQASPLRGSGAVSVSLTQLLAGCALWIPSANIQEAMADGVPAACPKGRQNSTLDASCFPSLCRGEPWQAPVRARTSTATVQETEECEEEQQMLAARELAALRSAPAFEPGVRLQLFERLIGTAQSSSASSPPLPTEVVQIINDFVGDAWAPGGSAAAAAFNGALVTHTSSTLTGPSGVIGLMHQQYTRFDGMRGDDGILDFRFGTSPTNWQREQRELLLDIPVPRPVGAAGALAGRRLTLNMRSVGRDDGAQTWTLHLEEAPRSWGLRHAVLPPLETPGDLLAQSAPPWVARTTDVAQAYWTVEGVDGEGRPARVYLMLVCIRGQVLRWRLECSAQGSGVLRISATSLPAVAAELILGPPALPMTATPGLTNADFVVQQTVLLPGQGERLAASVHSFPGVTQVLPMREDTEGSVELTRPTELFYLLSHLEDVMHLPAPPHLAPTIERAATATTHWSRLFQLLPRAAHHGEDGVLSLVYQVMRRVSLFQAGAAGGLRQQQVLPAEQLIELVARPVMFVVRFRIGPSARSTAELREQISLEQLHFEAVRAQLLATAAPETHGALLERALYPPASEEARRSPYWLEVVQARFITLASSIGVPFARTASPRDLLLRQQREVLRASQVALLEVPGEGLLLFYQPPLLGNSRLEFFAPGLFAGARVSNVRITSHSAIHWLQYSSHPYVYPRAAIGRGWRLDPSQLSNFLADVNLRDTEDLLGTGGNGAIWSATVQVAYPPAPARQRPLLALMGHTNSWSGNVRSWLGFALFDTTVRSWRPPRTWSPLPWHLDAQVGVVRMSPRQIWERLGRGHHWSASEGSTMRTRMVMPQSTLQSDRPGTLTIDVQLRVDVPPIWAPASVVGPSRSALRLPASRSLPLHVALALRWTPCERCLRALARRTSRGDAAYCARCLDAEAEAVQDADGSARALQAMEISPERMQWETVARVHVSLELESTMSRTYDEGLRQAERDAEALRLEDL